MDTSNRMLFSKSLKWRESCGNTERLSKNPEHMCSSALLKYTLQGQVSNCKKQTKKDKKKKVEKVSWAISFLKDKRQKSTTSRMMAVQKIHLLFREIHRLYSEELKSWWTSSLAPSKIKFLEREYITKEILEGRVRSPAKDLENCYLQSDMNPGKNPRMRLAAISLRF